MIYYFIGAALFIVAAWVASNHTYNKSIIVSQNKRIGKLMADIRHYENALTSYKESREYYKEKYRDLHRDYTILIDSIKNQTPQP